MVEDSLDWDPRHDGSAASGGGGAIPAGVPALITAGELASTTHNKAFPFASTSCEWAALDVEFGTRHQNGVQATTAI